jgi:hypothetical protein
MIGDRAMRFVQYVCMYYVTIWVLFVAAGTQHLRENGLYFQPSGLVSDSARFCLFKILNVVRTLSGRSCPAHSVRASEQLISLDGSTTPRLPIIYALGVYIVSNYFKVVDSIVQQVIRDRLVQ